MRIAFIIPDKQYPWHSIRQGVGYIAAYAKKHVPDIQCGVGMQDHELVEYLATGWDVIDLTLKTTAIDEARSFLPAIKQEGNATIVAGASEVTSVEEKLFSAMQQIDLAVFGVGKITFADLGATEGDTTFFLELLELNAEIVDHSPMSFTSMQGALALKETLTSLVDIHDVNIDVTFN